MYVIVRSYSGQGASELFDLLGEREEDVKELISGVPGFVSYAAFRSGDGGATVTICEDKAGTDESSKRAAADGVQERQSDSDSLLPRSPRALDTVMLGAATRLTSEAGPMSELSASAGPAGGKP